MAERCPICRFPATFQEKELVTVDNLRGAIYPITCQRCGSYKIKDRAKALFEHPDIVQEGKRGIISSWISERQHFYIDEEKATRLLHISAPPLSDRIMRLLLYIFNSTESIGKYVTIDLSNPNILNYTYSSSQEELHDMLDYLDERKHTSTLNELGYTKTTKITMDGILFIEKSRSSNIDSTQGFVAMWFKESMTPIYDSTIAPAISNIGYTPHRVDRREHAGKVDDEIIAQIRRSKFVVADFTGHRGGVYYEAGFAHGLGLPVIMTCQEDHLNELHFDIRQYNCILWKEDNLQEFQERLQNRIEATLGRGPLIHDTK